MGNEKVYIAYHIYLASPVSERYMENFDVSLATKIIVSTRRPIELKYLYNPIYK